MKRFTIKTKGYREEEIETDDWRKVVGGLNLSMATVDAPEENLEVIDNETGEKVYEQ